MWGVWGLSWLHTAYCWAFHQTDPAFPHNPLRSVSSDDRQQQEEAAAAAAASAAPPAPPAAAGAKAAAAAAAAGGKKKPGGLKLAVGSQIDHGEWTSHGQFLKKEKAGTEIPNGLQQIKVDDLIKVRGCGGEG